MTRARTVAVAFAATALAVGAWAVPASAASGTLSGTAFLDADRDAALDAGESLRSGDKVYLYATDGTYLRNAVTDSAGRYVFTDLPGGSYRVAYAPTSWWGLRADLVSTTADLRASRQVVVDGPTTADFGWRPIVRSTTAGSPISAFTGPEGLRVESYDDVVTARELYDAILRGSAGAVGAEAATTVVRFDLASSSTTSTSIGSSGGRYTSFRATVGVTWLSWLDGGDTTLSHEYGHAWSLYRAHLVQQDPTLAGYLDARGLTGDPRLGSDAWSPRELVAEDYRQLLGSPTAAAAPQSNRDLPPAASVPGLRDYLVGAFSTGTVAVEPTASPSATPSPAPSTSPSASPSPTATASVTSPTPTSGKKCRRC